MFIDASAITAILNREPGYENLVRRIEDGRGPIYTSPLSRLEATASLARQRAGRNENPTSALIAQCATLVSALLNEMGVKDIHITSGIGDAAIRAVAEYGSSVGHDADLNFGDCIAYACAKAYRLKLIYAGSGFAKTDLG